ncbi:MAG: FISUMP domain-containing protein [Terricaulis sp.]
MRRRKLTTAAVVVLALELMACSSVGMYRPRHMADGRVWTTRNLALRVASSYCYNDDDANCRVYGRLYVWDSAQRACELLGRYWRLPRDDEWRRLARAYSASGENPDDGRASYAALIDEGAAHFNALLGGSRSPEGEYARLGAHGLYWAGTASEPSGRWYYNFAGGSQALHSQDGGDEQRALSVRCIRDTQG